MAGPAAKLKTRSWAVHEMERGLVARENGRVVAREAVKVLFRFFKRRKVFGVVAAEVAMAVWKGWWVDTDCQGRFGSLYIGQVELEMGQNTRFYYSSSDTILGVNSYSLINHFQIKTFITRILLLFH